MNLYNPPGTTVPSQFPAEVLTAKNTIEVGEFDVHDVEWTASRSEAKGTVLEELTKERELILMHNKMPTYMNKKVGADSIIDLTFLNWNLAIRARTNVSTLNFDSDPFAVVVAIKAGLKENIVYKSRWNPKKADWQSYKQELDSVVSIEQCATEDIDELFANTCNRVYINSLQLRLQQMNWSSGENNYYKMRLLDEYNCQ